MPAQSRTWRCSSSRFASYPCMGRSASRLSRTRSGVVMLCFLAAAIVRLSLPAPIPPLALIEGQERIASLGHGRTISIQTADVLRFAGDLAYLLVKFLWVLP